MKGKLKFCVLTGTLAFALLACDRGAKTEAPLEQAQKSVEQNVQQAGETMEKTAESAADNLKDSAGAVQKSFEKAADNAQK